MSLTFEWDSEKARLNHKVHGVTFLEALTVFGDRLGRISDDPHHAWDERRSLLMGLSSRGTLLVVVFADRGERIRIISARRATHHERTEYEESKGKDGL